LYERSVATGQIRPAKGEAGQLRTICPLRFEESGAIYRWVGETVLACAEPLILGEIGFLESPSSEEVGPPSDVGRIDKVLLVPDSRPLSWCALEVQAVYFQGRAMRFDFAVIRDHVGEGLPFPEVLRRPDYRSSGSKRLMPQLQIKVPSLRRWGKKMVVVVDRSFFQALGRMRSVPHISNGDVAWFVVKFEERGGGFRLTPDTVQYTTLEDSVEGLTAGVSVSLDVFEERILAKLKRFSRPRKITSDQ
jgi:Restriction endonuclease NotI